MGWTPPHLIGIEVSDWKRYPPVTKEKSTMKLIRVGVDLAKNVFQVHGLDRQEKALWRRRLTREKWLKLLRETVEGYRNFKPPFSPIRGDIAAPRGGQFTREGSALRYQVPRIALIHGRRTPSHRGVAEEGQVREGSGGGLCREPRRGVEAGAELTKCAGFDLTRVRPMNTLVSR